MNEKRDSKMVSIGFCMVYVMLMSCLGYCAEYVGRLAQDLHLKAYELAQQSGNLDEAIENWTKAYTMRGVSLKFANKVEKNLSLAYLKRFVERKNSKDLINGIKCYLAFLKSSDSMGVKVDELVQKSFASAILKSLSSVLALAESGDVTAMDMLAKLYFDGDIVAQSYGQAKHWAEKATEKGSGASMFLLGKLYVDGLGVEKSSSEAIKYWRNAGDAGNAVAFTRIGQLYLGRDDVVKSLDEACKWWQKAVNLEEPYAMALLGWAYMTGSGVDKSYDIAESLLKRATKAGVVQATNWLGGLYCTKGWRGFSEEKARNVYKAGAENGDDSSLYMYGVMCINGQGGARDCSMGNECFRKAASNGVVLAMSALATSYYYGPERGMAKNYDEAFKWYHLAAKKGNSNAQWMYGCMLWRGEGCEKNEAEAKLWIQRAAKAGVSHAAKFLEDLGSWQKAEGERSELDAKIRKMHVDALDLQCRWNADIKTLNKSIELWEGAMKSLKLTSPEEMTGEEIGLSYKMAYNLFNAYAVRWKKLKVRDDVAASISSYLLTRVIKSRIADGADKLIPEDESRKRITALLPDIKSLANDGNVGAMSMLGMLYLYGKSVPKSVVDAERWLSKAAKQGDEIAQTFLEKLKSGDTDDL